MFTLSRWATCRPYQRTPVSATCDSGYQYLIEVPVVSEFVTVAVRSRDKLTLVEFMSSLRLRLHLVLPPERIIALMQKITMAIVITRYGLMILSCNVQVTLVKR